MKDYLVSSSEYSNLILIPMDNSCSVTDMFDDMSTIVGAIIGVIAFVVAIMVILIFTLLICRIFCHLTHFKEVSRMNFKKRESVY